MAKRNGNQANAPSNSNHNAKWCKANAVPTEALQVPSSRLSQVDKEQL